jgi:hypothetical protein
MSSEVPMFFLCDQFYQLVDMYKANLISLI